MTALPLFRKLLLAALLLTPLAPWAGEVEMTSYTHEGESFTVHYPSEWEARENLTYDLYKIPFLAVRPLEGENDTIRENVNVTTEKVFKGLTLEAYVKASLKGLPKGLQSFKKGREGSLSDAKAPCRYFLYTHKMDGVVYKAVVFLYLKGKKGYCLTCTSSPKRYDSFEDLFMTMGRSFDP